MVEIEIPSTSQIPLLTGSPDVIKPQHLEHYAPLGAVAVAAEEGKLWNDMKGEYFREVADYLAPFDASLHADYRSLAKRVAKNGDINEKNRSTALLEVREKLLGLDEKNREILNKYLQAHLPEAFKSLQISVELREAENAEGGEEEVAHEPDNVSWLATAPNNQLLNFLQWHNHRIEAVNNDPAVQEKLQKERSAFTEMVQAAVAEGDLRDVVLERLADIDTIPTFIGDTFDTAMQDRAGYYRPSDGNIVLQENYQPGTHFHELTHALLGEMADELFDEPVFDEAMVEHVVLSLQNGNFHIMDPVQRDDEGQYVARRHMYSQVLRSGLNRNLISDAIAGFCAKDTESPEHAAYEDKLLESYDGIPIRTFVLHEMEEAFDLIKNGRKILGLSPEDYALKYAADGVKYMGAILRGKTDEEILAPSIRRIKSLNAPAWKTDKLIAEMTAERRGRITSVRRYIAAHKEKVAA